MSLPSEDFPARVIFTDKSGTFRWFSPKDAKGTWSDSRPIPTLLSWLPNDQWIQWVGRFVCPPSITPEEANELAQRMHVDGPRIQKIWDGEIVTRIVSESEAIQWLLNLNLEPPDCPALRALEVGAAKEERLDVYDSDSGAGRRFDPAGCEKWGPYLRLIEWCSLNDAPRVEDEEWLYRHPTGHWTLVSFRSHCEVGLLGDPTANRLTDEAAAKWLFWAGFDVPADVACFVESLHYRPDEVTPNTDETAPTGETKEVPVWDAELRVLRFRGEVIRKVRPVAKLVLRLLEEFEFTEWQRRIESPFDDDDQKTREAVASTNNGLKAIRFQADGTGKGIEWEVINEETAADNLADETPF